MSFILKNISDDRVGPLGLSTQTTLAVKDVTYNVTNVLISDFILDPSVKNNLLNGKLCIVVGSVEFTGNDAIDYIATLGIAATAGSKLGQATKANSMPVTLASDEDSLDVNIAGGTSFSTVLNFSELSDELEAYYSAGYMKTTLRSTVKGGTAAGDITSTNVDTNTQALDVSVKGTAAISAASLPLPSGAATSANQTSVQGSAGAGTAATSSELVGGIYSSTPISLTNGQQSGIRLNSSGQVIVDTELASATTIADASANPTTSSIGAYNMGYNGTSWDRLRSDTTNGLDVDVTRVSGNVTVVQPTGSNLHVAVDSLPSLPAGLNNIGSIGNTSFGASQSGTWNIRTQDSTGNALTSTTSAPVGTESGLITRNIPSGTQTVTVGSALPTGSNTIGSIANVSGTVSLPTGAATETTLNAVKTAVELLDNAIGTKAAGTAGVNSLLTGAVFNTTLPTLTDGQQVATQVCNRGRPIGSVSNGRRSYAAHAGSTAGFTAAATANTDIFIINGSASATIYIKKIRISAIATAAQGQAIYVVKRSTANTGGTAINSTNVSYDSTQTAASAVAKHYTVAPTLGTMVGVIRGARVIVPTSTGLVYSQVIFEFTENGGNPVVLRGTAEGLSVFVGVAPGAGNNFQISIEWDEE